MHFNTSVISYQAHCQQIVFSDTALKHVNYMILQLTLILHYAGECTVFVSLAVPSNKEWHKLILVMAIQNYYFGKAERKRQISDILGHKIASI